MRTTTRLLVVSLVSVFALGVVSAPADAAARVKPSAVACCR
jgi:hypothetical protein